MALVLQYLGLLLLTEAEAEAATLQVLMAVLVVADLAECELLTVTELLDKVIVEGQGTKQVGIVKLVAEAVLLELAIMQDTRMQETAEMEPRLQYLELQSLEAEVAEAA